jgi:hypothetical protein
MLRVIDLRSPERALTEERFGILYSLILLGALIAGQSQKRTLEDTRNEMKVMDAIAAISDVDPDESHKTAIGTRMRVLKRGAKAVIEADQQSHEIVVKYLETAIPAVVPEVSYKALPILDIVKAAQISDGAEAGRRRGR